MNDCRTCKYGKDDKWSSKRARAPLCGVPCNSCWAPYEESNFPLWEPADESQRRKVMEILSIRSSDPQWMQDIAEQLEAAYMSAHISDRQDAAGYHGDDFYLAVANTTAWNYFVGSMRTRLKIALVLLYLERGGTNRYPTPSEVKDLLA